MTVVDVVLPVRDGGAWLRDAVDSVLSQQGVDLHLWVVDDGSSDGAPQQLPPDGRLTVLPARSRGLVAALQQGFAAGTAPLVARQDADDVSLPGRLARQVEHLEAHPGIGLVSTAFEVLVGGRVVSRVATGPAGALERNPFCAGSVMVRRAVWQEAGGVRDVPYAEDYDLWLRCAEVSGVSVLEPPGYRYRLHAGMSSLRHAAAQGAAAKAVQQAARARAAGLPDPLSAGLCLDAVEEDAATLVWWADEFAALGSEEDAAQCRALAGLTGAWTVPAAPQAVWS